MNGKLLSSRLSAEKNVRRYSHGGLGRVKGWKFVTEHMVIAFDEVVRRKAD